MLEFSALSSEEGEKPQAEASVLRGTPASCVPQEETPQGKKTARISHTVPPQSVLEFIQGREDPATRAERMGLPGMIEDLREQLAQVEASIRVFKRLEAAKYRGLVRPAPRVPSWATSGRIHRPSSSV
jgi:hypothetical protein